MPGFTGVDSEVGRLRAVIVHRPGAELKRVLPRNAGQLLFTGLPWAARAQQEHDVFTQALRDHGVQVLYLTELLRDVLEYAPARQQAITAALGSVMLGDELAAQVRRHLDGLDPEALAETLIIGLTAGEFRPGRGAVYQLLGTSDFILRPQPDLVFFRDPSVWVGDQKQAIFGFRGTDPALMDAAIATIVGAKDPTTLAQSRRSRPELVGLTSRLFAAAFARQGIPASRVTLTPEPDVEPEPDDPNALTAPDAQAALPAPDDERT